MKKILIPLFYCTAFYSFLALPIFAQKTGGACNAGVAIVGIGLFLLISMVLLFFAIRNGEKALGKILSILSLLIWSFWAVVASIDDPVSGLIYFSPFLITIMMALIFAMKRNVLSNEESN